MTFENQPIPIATLPHVEEAELQPLAPMALKARYWGNLITLGVILVFSLAVLPPAFSRWWWLFAGVILVVAVGLFFFLRWFIRKRFEAEGYALREHDIIHQHGYWWKTQTTAPFARVQHVEIAQGPIDKRFGISTLRVFTAGGGSSDLSISGIALEEAHRIKSFIVGKAGVDDAT